MSKKKHKAQERGTKKTQRNSIPPPPKERQQNHKEKKKEKKRKPHIHHFVIFSRKNTTKFHIKFAQKHNHTHRLLFSIHIQRVGDGWRG
jgi:hypothetical protein